MTIVGSNPGTVIGGVTWLLRSIRWVGCWGWKRSPPLEPDIARLLGWLRSLGELILVGVDGTGSYGVGLSRYPARAGIAVVEVDRPNRQVRHRRGKSDPADAVAAARAVGYEHVGLQIDPAPTASLPGADEIRATITLSFAVVVR